MSRKYTAVLLSSGTGAVRSMCGIRLRKWLRRNGCGCPTSAQAAEQRTRAGEVVVAMDPNSEPAAGFDPAYGWGAQASMSTSR